MDKSEKQIMDYQMNYENFYAFRLVTHPVHIRNTNITELSKKWGGMGGKLIPLQTKTKAEKHHSLIQNNLNREGDNGMVEKQVSPPMGCMKSMESHILHKKGTFNLI